MTHPPLIRPRIAAAALMLLAIAGLCLALCAPSFADAGNPPSVVHMEGSAGISVAPRAPMVLGLSMVQVPAAAPATSIALPDPGSDPTGIAKAIYDAVTTKNLKVAVVLLTWLLVFALRKWGTDIAFFKTDRGGALLALTIGVFGALVTTAATGVPLSFQFVIDGVMNGVTAAGGYVVIKRVIWPRDVPKAAAGT